MSIEDQTAQDQSPTPADRRRERVRNEIISAAEHVFADKGYEGLSMRRIAKQIDYSPAAIYKYFPSKSDLIICIREMFFERLLRRLDEVVEEDWTLACARDALRAYIDCGLEEPNHYRIAFMAEGVDPPGPGSLAMEAGGRLRDMVQEGMDLGHFAQADPGIAAKATWAAVHGLTLLLADMPSFSEPPNPADDPFASAADREALIDFQVSLIIRGLCAGSDADSPI